VGISGVVVVAESHLAIHNWPEKRSAAIDVFTSGTSVRMEAASALLIEVFRCKRPLQRYFKRSEQLVQ
jgi:S-adenosylmethionine decarboxylase